MASDIRGHIQITFSTGNWPSDLGTNLANNSLIPCKGISGLIARIHLIIFLLKKKKLFTIFYLSNKKLQEKLLLAH